MSAVANRRRRGGREQTGQALALVMGIVVILTLGGTILVQNFEQQSPIVETDLIEHQAYRAVQAGIDEYLYKSNVNSDYIICDSSNQGTGFCPGLTFAQWIPVQGASANNGPPSWFYFSDPQLTYSTGTVAMTVEGASGYPNDYSYQTATITLQPLNNFLLNVLWINYNQIDPAVLNANNPPNCGYYWQVGIENGCSDVDFVNGDSLDGNLYVNDSIFTCGSPQFETVHTADPNEQFVKDCSGTPDVTGAEGYGSAVEDIPQDDSQLALVAAEDGCLYEGPTTIVLSGTTMSVDSPDTPTGAPSGAPNGSASNDSIDQAGNTSACINTTTPNGGSVAVPNNGVIFVENCLSGNSSCTGGGAYNPMSGEGETGATGPTYGDAIVNGTLSGPLTIGAQNNVIIDGNICYSSETTCASTTGESGGPPTSATDVLGLIAYNYVEVNHPVNNGNNISLCGVGSHPPAAPACDLGTSGGQGSPLVINAVILALNHSFLVNNYGSGAPLGTLTVNGTVSEDWRGPVGTSNNGTIVTGYAKNYQYDSRLRYFAPPYYLSPGTASWGIASFSVQSICTVSCTNP